MSLGQLSVLVMKTTYLPKQTLNLGDIEGLEPPTYRITGRSNQLSYMSRPLTRAREHSVRGYHSSDCLGRRGVKHY